MYSYISFPWVYFLYPFIIHSQSSQEANVYITCNFIWRCSQGWFRLDQDSQSKVWLIVICNHLFYFKTCLHCIEHQHRCDQETHSPVPAGDGSSVWLGVDYYFSQWEKKREDRKDETNIIPNSCSGIWVMIQGIFKRFRKVLPKTLLPISWCSNMEPGLVDQLDLSDTRAHCLKLHPHIPAKDRGTGHAKVDW